VPLESVSLHVFEGKSIIQRLTKLPESGFTWEIVEALFGFDGIDLCPRNIAPRKQN